MFNRNNSSGLTAAEAQEYADKLRADLTAEARAAFVTREDAQSYADALSALDARVVDLERLASQLRRDAAVRALSAPRAQATTEQPRQAEARGTYDGITGSSRASEHARSEVRATGVDYGAVAFGLSEIKRKVAQVVSDSSLRAEYEGAVQYFADVFAKSDPQFDAALFKRQAGV